MAVFHLKRPCVEAAAASQTFSMKPTTTSPTPPEAAAQGRRRSRGSCRIQKSRSFVRRDLMKRCYGAMVGWYGGFLAFTLLHFADWLLRIYSIYLHARHEMQYVAFAMLLPIQDSASVPFQVLLGGGRLVIDLHHAGSLTSSLSAKEMGSGFTMPTCCSSCTTAEACRSCSSRWSPCSSWAAAS